MQRNREISRIKSFLADKGRVCFCKELLKKRKPKQNIPREKQTHKRIAAKEFLADLLRQNLLQPGFHFVPFGLGPAMVKTEL